MQLSVIDLFEQAVLRQPDAVAIEAGERRLTYSELDAAANRLALRIADLGVAREECVGVVADRGADAVVAYLGVLKAGGAYVPLAPDSPAAWQRAVLEEVGARIVIAEQHHAANALAYGFPVITPNSSRSGAGERDSEPRERGGPGDLIYVMFTSGSSGRPKGVAVEHRNVVRLTRQVPDLMPRAGEAVLAASRLDGDIATREIWGTLLNGGRLAIHEPGVPDPRRVAQTIRRHEVTVAGVSTGLFHQLVEHGLDELGGLRLLLVGGDVLSPGHAERFIHAHPECRLVNSYGPTEAAVSASFHDVDRVEAGQPVPIGSAEPHVGLYVLDEEGQPVADGRPGELYIGGAGVARGYVNRPDATADAFMPDPFAGDPDARMYRTGDFVRRRHDGALDFLGRRDRQVKVRGHRVEPAEIEARIAGVPGIRQALVVPREDTRAQRQLVAYVVPANGGFVDTNGLRAQIAELLPSHMLPSALIPLEELPLAPTGKVDVAALPAPHSAPGRAPHRAPSSPVEHRLVEVWRDALELDPIGMDDDFFELGGDSLLAMQVLARLRHDAGVELPLSALFECPTPAKLAARIAAGGVDAAPLPPLRRGREGNRAPVSVSQAQVCFVCELDPESLAYQSQTMLELNGPLDRAALEGALTEIVRRHEIYRTTFPRAGDTWVQEIHPAAPVRLEVQDLSSEADQDAALERFTALGMRRRIEIDRLPLVHWSLARLAPDCHALLHVEHHLVHDGWSLMVFLRELRELYTAAVEGREPSLEELSIQYADFARWQHDLLGSDVAGRQLAYWKRRLAEAPDPLELPYETAPASRQTFRGRKISRTLPPRLVARLRRQAQGGGATLFMVTFAAFAALLHRYTGATDVVVGSGASNRRLREFEAVMGMFVNTVALRVDLSGDPSTRELVERVREVAVAAYANQDVPFEQVVQAVSPARSGSHTPLYQTLFSFHDSPIPDLDEAGLRIVPDETLDNGSAKAEINVVAINHRRAGAQTDDLTLVWEYNSDLFAHDTIDRMVGHYVRLLEGFSEEPDRPVSALGLLVPEEEARLAELAGRRVDYERDSSVAEVFLERVLEQPDAIALAGDREAMSYGELNSSANRLAHRLRRMGVRQGSLVGVCLPRSPEMVVALLAILKAGGAYVPLDPSVPRARMELLLRDAQPAVVVTGTEDSHRLPPGVELVCLDQGGSELAGEPDGELDSASGPADLAYVTYTSGSTGEPKGVEVTQRGVVRLVRGADYVRLDRDQTLLALAPLSFDASTFEIWGALLNGGRLALAPAGSLSPFEIAAAVERHRVTTLWLTAGLFNRFVELEPGSLRRLDQILAGGDVLSHAHVVRALSLLSPGAVLVNGYGPTEGTTFTATHRLRPGDEVPLPVPIGRPIANTTVHILDERGMPAPLQVAGELCIGGDGVARGYLGRPNLTSERFVDDPVRGRLYRSGDLARWRRDGTLEFLGRNDRQVKVRGFRIEPAEVEAALLSHPDVREAVVMARGEQADERRLVAYVTGRHLTDRSRTALRAFLADRVPGHMIPSAWVVLERLPLSDSGKVDHRALPGPQAAAPSGTARAGDDIERAVAAIFEEVLGVAAVGPGDDFFELGGHSLLAVRLFADIEERLGTRLPLAAIFDAPTVEGIASAVRGGTSRSRWSSLVPVAGVGSRPPLFLVTAGDGNSVGFGALGRRLAGLQPVYALQPRGLDGRARLHVTVEAMARHYLAEVRAAQPDGPYLLGGRCLGGLVAFEMARQLLSAGDEVALLAILDSLGPSWQRREIEAGLAYDEVMNLCRLRARRLGAPAGLGTPREVDAFLDWIRQPEPSAGPEINRYLHEVYLARPDVRAAYPDVPGADTDRLIDWAWTSGIAEMELQPTLLPVPSADRPPLSGNRGSRLAGVRGTVRESLADTLDVALRGRSGRLGARRARRLAEIANHAASRYRAGPYRGRIELIRTAEFVDNVEIARWHGVARAEVIEHRVLGSHRSMLREPDVASLAECLDGLIAAGLGEEEVRESAA